MHMIRWITILLALTSAAGAQPTDGTGGPTTQPRRGPRRDVQRREQATQPPLNIANEMDRRRYERILESASRTYNLDELQRAMVRNEIETMSAERRVAMGADAGEYDRLREKLQKMQSPVEGTEQTPEARRARFRAMRDSPEFRELRTKLAELDRKYPIDMEAAIGRVEKLLPPEQAAAGRERRERRMVEFRERRGRRRGENATSQPSLGATMVKREAAEDVKAPAPPPMHPWEKYVREFVSRNELTDAQTNAALAMLKDVQGRAGQVEALQADRVAAANSIRDGDARKKALAEMNKPYDELFEELKRRLDALLTAAQRAKSGEPRG
ncbi:MAG: hypothetical protein HZA51_08360 [Planctomycetes bacterium]|nr:hypothetical protein [Planctomycetota bacterium]